MLIRLFHVLVIYYICFWIVNYIFEYIYIYVHICYCTNKCMLLQEFSSFFNLNFAPGLLLQSRLRYCVHRYIEHVRILSAPKWGFRQEGLQLIFMEWAKPSYDRRIDE
jgi:hypothetical protein